MRINLNGIKSAVNMDINNSIRSPSQKVYDSFNFFMFSNDTKVIGKLFARLEFFNKTKDLPGDIVECGVFKGSGMMCWLKFIQLYSHNSIKKVIGFDFFDKSFINNLEEKEKKYMSDVFSRCETNNLSKKYIEEQIKNTGITSDKFELIEGDISKSSLEFRKQRPGFRISILYLDLDLDKPTYDTLQNLWDCIVPGGYIIFDEYGYHMWSESNGVDRFLKNKKIKLQSTNYPCPSAFVIKPL